MAKKRRLRVASYNINGINPRLHVLARWLEEFQPDVACLQELKCTDEAFPREAIETLGYCAIWHGQKSWNGVAILSRVGAPVETRRGLPDDPDPSHSRYIEAAVCGLLIGNLYAPNGNPWPGPKFDYVRDVVGAQRKRCQPTPANSSTTVSTVERCCARLREIAACFAPTPTFPALLFRRRGTLAVPRDAAPQFNFRSPSCRTDRVQKFTRTIRSPRWNGDGDQRQACQFFREA